MIYTIVVDKQSRANPSGEQREFDIEVGEELRRKGNVCDEICIKDGNAKLIRRISIGKYKVTKILENPIETDLGEIKLKLFEGDNYIYIKDKTGDILYAEYLVKNDFNNMYVIKAELDSAIEQTAQSISLSVDQKLEGYSTTEEMQSAIEMKADSITSSVNSKLKSYDTSEEVNSKIEQKANSITSTVSSTYATKTQLNTAKSEIKQTTDAITTTVSKKVGNNEIISKINQSSEAVTINANKINLSGYVTMNNLKTAGQTIIDGSNITTGTIDASKANITNINANNIKSGTITGRTIMGGSINGTTITGGSINGGKIVLKDGSRDNANLTVINSSNNNINTQICASEIYINTNNGGVYINNNSSMVSHAYIYNDSIGGGITLGGKAANDITLKAGTNPRITCYGEVQAIAHTNISLKSKKKNIKKLNANATELIKNADICLYNLKGEKTKSKKHIGLIIGEGYNCPDEVISQDKQGVEQYSMISIAWKAIQELIKQNQNLKERIEKLETK